MGRPRKIRTLEEVAEENKARLKLVHNLILRTTEEGLWDSIKAKDIDPQIVEHVIHCFQQGMSPAQVRSHLGLGGSTSKAWIKVSAALKMGWRVDSAGFFVRLIGRNEKLADKMHAILEQVLDQDIESLKEIDKDGRPYLATYANYVTSMVDSMSKLQQATVKIGKDLGIFVDGSGESRSGTTIVIKNNVQLPSAQEIIDARTKRDVLTDSSVKKP